MTHDEDFTRVVELSPSTPSAGSTAASNEKAPSEPDFGPDSDTHEDRGYAPRCDHHWGVNGCQKCGQPSMPRG